MTLLIDAGSTRLKWLSLEANAAAGTHPAAPTSGDGDLQRIFGGITPAPRRVVVANSAGAAFAVRLRDWARRTWLLEPEFPVATREACGVRNAYARPGSLGIDRWLGMLAARHAARGPLVVANAGAAFTIDLVDGDGRHRGGGVVPGAALMREALYAQTSDVAAAARADPPAVDGIFGINTAGGVRQGGHLALAALSDRAALALEGTAGRTPEVFLTGESAAEVAPLMTYPVQHVPDLVLQGLALLLREGSA
jgi:type III pantothenate kinase